MTIYQKLILGFVGIALLVGVVGGAAITVTYGIRYHIDTLLRENLNEAESTAKIAYHIQRIVSGLSELLLDELLLETGGARPEDVEYAKSEITKNTSELQKYVGVLEKSKSLGLTLLSETEEEETEEEKKEREKLSLALAVFTKTKTEINNFIGSTNKIYSLSNNPKEATQLFETELKPISRELQVKIEDLKNSANRGISGGIKEVKTELMRIIAFSFISLYIALVVAFGLGYLISKHITDSIMKIKDTALELGRGKFGIQVNVRAKDEIGVLADTFNKISNMLLELVNKEKELSAKTAAAEAQAQKAAELEKAYTTLKETQYQLIQAEKMTAIGQLASGVAHEIKNPLAIILQGVSYLGDKIHREKKDEFEALDMVKDAVERADRIVDTLLDFSRAKKLTLEEEKDINTILENALTLLKTELKFEMIEVVKEMKKGLPAVLIDKNKMGQVFVNILLNAVQSMPEGGKITIRTYDKLFTEAKDILDKREWDYFQAGERVIVIEIEDTGAGISEEMLKKVFVPFYTTKGPKGGCGLGLAVSRNIVGMHKGAINIESRVGKGTKIIVMLKVIGG
ncbi:MAG: ATP-binding protein [Candidatus Omnitrophota bacterium]|nr:ATP-binding protein [Candidatus Omnitrophota bacterium]